MSDPRRTIFAMMSQAERELYRQAGGRLPRNLGPPPDPEWVAVPRYSGKITYPNWLLELDRKKTKTMLETLKMLPAPAGPPPVARPPVAKNKPKRKRPPDPRFRPRNAA